MSVRDPSVIMATDAESNKALVLAAFASLFDRRDFDAAERFYSENYIQHSALIRRDAKRCSTGLGHCRPCATRINWQSPKVTTSCSTGESRHQRRCDGDRQVVRAQDGLLAEHWDTWQKEAARAESLSGLPRFGDSFPDRC
jgi:predicted SnoaL-like aldol condensation-catalyzing enzyme